MPTPSGTIWMVRGRREAGVGCGEGEQVWQDESRPNIAMDILDIRN